MLILYVDDDFEDAEIFQEAIANIDSSISPEIILDSTKVLSAIDLRCPDYVFLDYRMPKMNGKDVLIQLQSTKCSGQTKLVIYSSFIQEYEIEECKKLEFFIVLRKGQIIIY